MVDRGCLLTHELIFNRLDMSFGACFLVRMDFHRVKIKILKIDFSINVIISKN